MIDQLRNDPPVKTVRLAMANYRNTALRLAAKWQGHKTEVEDAMWDAFARLPDWITSEDEMLAHVEAQVDSVLRQPQPVYIRFAFNQLLDDPGCKTVRRAMHNTYRPFCLSLAQKWRDRTIPS